MWGDTGASNFNGDRYLHRESSRGVAIANVIAKKTNLRNKMIIRIARFASFMFVIAWRV